jgi:hypothetical protein
MIGKFPTSSVGGMIDFSTAQYFGYACLNKNGDVSAQ